MAAAALQFSIHSRSEGYSLANAAAGARRGTLHFTAKNKSVETPACLAYTVRGSVPHLVADNLKGLPVSMIHVALEHFVEQKQPSSFKYPHGLHNYLHLQDYLLFCDVRDPLKLAPASANTETYVAVDTHGGVRRVTSDVWIKAMEAYKPDWCATPADVVRADEEIKAKRIKKAVDRTLRWLDECLPKAQALRIPVFAPVVGFDNAEERIRSATAAAERDVQGFVINAFEMKKDEWPQHVATSIEHLPVSKPRLAYGLSSPEKILHAVGQGIDLFDGSYAFKMTERGRAITFKFGQSMPPAAEDEQEKTEKTMNLWDPKLAQCFEPIDVSCGCYTCATPYTKAYIHHLLNAHEMLGPLLIMSHNLYQLEQFMASIRHSIDNNTFEEDVTAFMNKYNHGLEPNGVVGHEDEVDLESLAVPVKKKRTILL